MRLFNLFEDDNNPSDEDLFGEDETEKFRQGIIKELNRILAEYHETPWYHRNQPEEKTRAEYAALEQVRDTFIKGGLINGLNSLDNPNLSHHIIDYLDADLATNQRIDLGKVEAKYLNLSEETDPSDDELFGVQGPNVVEDDNARGIHFAPNKYKIKLKTTGEEFEIHVVDYGNHADEIWGGDADSLFPARIEIIPPQAVSYKGKWMIWLEKHFDKYLQMDGKEFLASRLDENEPNDSDLFGDVSTVLPSKQEFIKAFDSVLRELEYEISVGDDFSQDYLKYDYNEILNVRSEFVQHGVLEGLRELLEKQKDGQIDYFEMLSMHGINLDTAAQRLAEDDPSDDELFGDEPKKANLSKVSTSNLIGLLHAFSSDTRPEYESAHTRQKFRIRQELERRGVPVPHGMNEDEPADDELFGGHSEKYDLSKVSTYNLNSLLRTFSNSESTNARLKRFHIKQELERRGVPVPHGMNEDEPSDDDLFGDRSSLTTNKIIEATKELKSQNIARFHQILADNHVSSVSDMDANDEDNWDALDEIDELNEHIDALNKMAKIFGGGLEDGLRYYANCIDHGYSGTEREIADYVEQIVMEKFNIDMKELVESLLGIKMDEAAIAEPEEPTRPQKTQTKDKPKLDPNVFGPRADQPLANREEPKSQQAKAPTINKASRSATQQAMRNVTPTDQMRDMLGRMRDIEIDNDLEDYPSVEPRDNEVSVNVNTENLPAVAGEAIQKAGMVSPDFHQVAALPGNISAMIRQLGKTLFGSMTNTKTSEIYVVANLGGQGPNSNREVQSVANFVRENGEDMGSGNIDFSQVMPGYSAETHQYSAAGIRWLLVRDFAGQYIYCWPEADSKQIGGQQARLR
jgi:hypothetical protein